MKKITALTTAFLIGITLLKAQDYPPQTQEVGFIIIYASKTYDAAKKYAEDASKALNYKLDFRDLEPNDEIGLSYSEHDCEEEGFGYPAYVQRGRDNDAAYVSVEYTNSYEGFTPGYYIVVVAHYNKGKPELASTLADVKKHYKTAYIKYTDIYIGCMH